jgi:hypothetical protein
VDVIWFSSKNHDTGSLSSETVQRLRISAISLSHLWRFSSHSGEGDHSLVLFNKKDPQDPEFQIRVRPQKHDPDMFYVNKYMKHVEGEMFS